MKVNRFVLVAALSSSAVVDAFVSVPIPSQQQGSLHKTAGIWNKQSQRELLVVVACVLFSLYLCRCVVVIRDFWCCSIWNDANQMNMMKRWWYTIPQKKKK